MQYNVSLSLFIILITGIIFSGARFMLYSAGSTFSHFFPLLLYWSGCCYIGCGLALYLARCKRRTFWSFMLLFFCSCTTLHICYCRTIHSTRVEFVTHFVKSRQHKLISLIGFRSLAVLCNLLHFLRCWRLQILSTLYVRELIEFTMYFLSNPGLPHAIA